MTIAGISIPGFDGKHGALQDVGTAALVGGGIVATGTALTVASRWLLEKPMTSPAMTTLKAFGVGAIVAGELAGLGHVHTGSNHVQAGYIGAGIGLAAVAGGTAAVAAVASPTWVFSHGKELAAVVLGAAAIGTLAGASAGAAGWKT